MKAYSSPLQERKSLWVSNSILVLMLAVLLGQVVTEIGAMPMSKKVVAPSMCPIVYRYILRDSGAFIPMTLTKSYTILCRVNTSSSLCDWILVASRGHSYYFNRDMKKRLYLYNMGLIIIQMSKELEGEYHVLSGVNRTCTVRILVTAVGKNWQWEENWRYHRRKGPLLLHRILLLVPGVMFLWSLGLLWDWLAKMCSQLAVVSGEQQRAHNEHIQHVIITPLQQTRNL